MNEVQSQNNLYKGIAIVAAILGLLSAVMFLGRGLGGANAADNGSRIRSGEDTSTMRTSSASTTIYNNIRQASTYLNTAGASSTLTFNTEDLESLAVEMIRFGSSTINNRSPLVINMWGSDNNIDFTPYDVSVAPAANGNGSLTIVAASGTPIVASWLPTSLTGTSSKLMNLPFIPHTWTRVQFGLATGTPKVVDDTIGFYANVIGVRDN